MKEGQVHIAPFVYWLGRTAPGLYRLAQSPWRVLKRVLNLNRASHRRRAFRYYEETVRLARAYVPAGGSVLDVGAHDGDVLRRLESIVVIR